jgi:transcriptional regulator with XRE-family HTH domain
MKFNDKYNIAPEFENLFSFKSKKEEIEHEAKMIMFRFLSELEKINSEKPVKKKELAQALKTSASYITQLYQGDKLINLLTLAKVQEAYNITFDIKAKHNTENYKEEIEQSYNSFFTKNKMADEDGHWFFVSKNDDYKNIEVECVDKIPTKLKVA